MMPDPRRRDLCSMVTSWGPADWPAYCEIALRLRAWTPLIFPLAGLSTPTAAWRINHPDGPIQPLFLKLRAPGGPSNLLSREREGHLFPSLSKHHKHHYQSVLRWKVFWNVPLRLVDCSWSYWCWGAFVCQKAALSRWEISVATSPLLSFGAVLLEVCCSASGEVLFPFIFRFTWRWRNSRRSTPRPEDCDCRRTGNPHTFCILLTVGLTENPQLVFGDVLMQTSNKMSYF